MRNLKGKNWLTFWEEYMSDTESPVEYNTWCGISALSASLKRNIWIQRPHFRIYPNIFLILVGPPGVGKGTAINPQLEVFDETKLVNVMSDRITAEKVVERLSDGFGSGVKNIGGKIAIAPDRTCVIAATELPLYLNSSVWTMELMCDLWDNKPGGTSYSTKTKSSFAAKDTCVSLVGGCVPDYIRKLNREAMTAITGGFTSRCIFVFASEKSQLLAWPTVNGHAGKLKADLINDLQHIGGLAGEVSFTPIARQMWENHYLGSPKADPFESEVLANFKSRTMAHVFKTAMALAVAEGDTLVINENHLRNAIGLINNVKKNMDIIFGAVGESNLAAAQDRVLRFVDYKGIVSRSEILKTNRRHITDEDLTRVLSILETVGLIKSHLQGGSIMYESTQLKGMAKVKGVP